MEYVSSMHAKPLELDHPFTLLCLETLMSNEKSVPSLRDKIQYTEESVRHEAAFLQHC